MRSIRDRPAGGYYASLNVLHEQEQCRAAYRHRSHWVVSRYWRVHLRHGGFAKNRDLHDFEIVIAGMPFEYARDEHVRPKPIATEKKTMGRTWRLGCWLFCLRVWLAVLSVASLSLFRPLTGQPSTTPQRNWPCKAALRPDTDRPQEYLERLLDSLLMVGSLERGGQDLYSSCSGWSLSWAGSREMAGFSGWGNRAHRDVSEGESYDDECEQYDSRVCDSREI